MSQVSFGVLPLAAELTVTFFVRVNESVAPKSVLNASALVSWDSSSRTVGCCQGTDGSLVQTSGRPGAVSAWRSLTSNLVYSLGPLVVSATSLPETPAGVVAVGEVLTYQVAFPFLSVFFCRRLYCPLLACFFVFSCCSCVCLSSCRVP